MADAIQEELEALDRVDARVPWRVFGFVAVFMAAMAVLYWFTSYEEAGTALLALASGLAGWTAVYLWLHERGAGQPEPAAEPTEPGEWLPPASVWPFGIGLGLTLCLNGLLIGVWFLIPGVMVLAISIGGFARESRHRE